MRFWKTINCKHTRAKGSEHTRSFSVLSRWRSLPHPPPLFPRCGALSPSRFVLTAATHMLSLSLCLSRSHSHSLAVTLSLSRCRSDDLALPLSPHLTVGSLPLPKLAAVGESSPNPAAWDFPLRYRLVEVITVHLA